MAPIDREAINAKVAADRAAQGLPPKIEGPATLRRIALLLVPRPRKETD